MVADQAGPKARFRVFQVQPGQGQAEVVEPLHDLVGEGVRAGVPADLTRHRRHLGRDGGGVIFTVLWKPPSHRPVTEYPTVRAGAAFCAVTTGIVTAPDGDRAGDG